MELATNISLSQRRDRQRSRMSAPRLPFVAAVAAQMFFVCSSKSYLNRQGRLEVFAAAAATFSAAMREAAAATCPLSPTC
jgi:hypothetical protein